MSERYDVIVIGTGAGGGTLLHALAPTGKRILVLERGGFLPREKENWRSSSVFLEGRYKAKETWYDADGKPFHPGTHYVVGGNTKVYGAALLRFRREDFASLRHEGGVSPAWPVPYDEMEAWYTAAERLYQVHGVRGSDPTEPPASAPYPFPAVAHEPRIQRLHDDLVRAGMRPFPLPLGIRLDERRPERSACIRCSTCDGFPCLVDAKSDAHVTCVRPALGHPNVTLLTDAKAVRLATTPSGREVRAVVVERGGRTESYEADLFVVACGAVNSAALLLRSADDRHPRGLANRSDVVGRNYMCHNNSALLALSLEENPTTFQKTLALNDWYFGDEDFPHPMGHVQMLGKSDADMLRGDAPAFAPGAALEAMARRSLDFWLTSEDLPDPENRVLALPGGEIRLHHRPNNLRAHEELTSRLKTLLSRIGCEGKLVCTQTYLGKRIPIAGVAHQCGTVRFGDDPRTSALDRFCRAHDVGNLWVVDGSFFPSSSACNPALTIMANALRVGARLRSVLGA
jgi:choline dehydrogenase-like flavoprotein